MLVGKLGPDGLYDLSQMTLLILGLNLERVSKFAGELGGEGHPRPRKHTIRKARNNTTFRKHKQFNLKDHRDRVRAGGSQLKSYGTKGVRS